MLDVLTDTVAAIVVSNLVEELALMALELEYDDGTMAVLML